MSEIANKNDKALKVFFIITIGLSILLEAAIIYLKAMGLAAFLMWVPALGAFVVKQLYFKGEKGFLGFRKCNFKSGTPLWYKLIMFMLMIYAVGSIIALITIESKSIWPAIILHAAHNNFDQIVFGAYTQGNDRMYFVSETGALTFLVAGIIALAFYIRTKKKQLQAE